MESDKDSDKDSKTESIDWGLTFMFLKARNFSHNEILNLSYPQFNAYMNNIHNPLTYSITIPYMGSGEDKKEEFSSKEELLALVASMNEDFG